MHDGYKERTEIIMHYQQIKTLHTIHFKCSTNKSIEIIMTTYPQL